MVKAASEGLGFKAMTEDYLKPFSPWMYVNATAVIGVAQRVGLGKMRHLDTQSLWLQEAVRDNRVGLWKVHGPVNPADLMTKHVDHATQIRFLSLMGVEARMGRAESAPETGEVDEQGGSEEPGCEVIELNETEIDWIDESIDRWLHQSVIGFHGDAISLGHEIDTDARIGDSCGRRRRPPAQADNTQCTEKRKMSNEHTLVRISSCQTYDDHELFTQCTRKKEMSNEADDYESLI